MDTAFMDFLLPVGGAEQNAPGGENRPGLGHTDSMRQGESARARPLAPSATATQTLPRQIKLAERKAARPVVPLKLGGSAVTLPATRHGGLAHLSGSGACDWFPMGHAAQWVPPQSQPTESNFSKRGVSQILRENDILPPS